MIKNVKSDFRLSVAIGELLRKRAYFWTFTTSDVCSFSTVAARWREVRHFLGQHYKPFRYVQNFELHPLGHGWHVHFVSDTFIDLKKHYKKIQSFGFGRINVKVCYSSMISGYLTKHAFKPIKRNDKDDSRARFRRINVSRNLNCSLRRFEVVGGSSGWIHVYRNLKHHTIHNQIISCTYGLPQIEGFEEFFEVKGGSGRE